MEYRRTTERISRGTLTVDILDKILKTLHKRFNKDKIKITIGYETDKYKTTLDGKKGDLDNFDFEKNLDKTRKLYSINFLCGDYWESPVWSSIMFMENGYSNNMEIRGEDETLCNALFLDLIHIQDIIIRNQPSKFWINLYIGIIILVLIGIVLLTNKNLYWAVAPAWLIFMTGYEIKERFYPKGLEFSIEGCIGYQREHQRKKINNILLTIVIMGILVPFLMSKL